MKPTEAIAGINIGVLTGYGIHAVADTHAHSVLTWILILWCSVLGTAVGAVLFLWLDELIGGEK